MSSYDDPTQQVRRPEPPPAPLPGSLDPLRGHHANGWPQAPDSERFADDATADPDAAAATGVLPLDEIFAAVPTVAPASTGEAPAPAGPAEPAPTAAAEAPTWTAMPVVPVRSQPVAAEALQAAPVPTAGRPLPLPHTSPGGQRSGPHLGSRLRTDAASALSGTGRGIDQWLRRDDNGLMLLTSLVAVVLILVIAAVG